MRRLCNGLTLHGFRNIAEGCVINLLIRRDVLDRRPLLTHVYPCGRQHSFVAEPSTTG